MSNTHQTLKRLVKRFDIALVSIQMFNISMWIYVETNYLSR